MKISSILAFASAFADEILTGEARAKEICDDVSGGNPKVFGYRFKGIQAKLWECTFDVTDEFGEASERKTLVKIYNNPQFTNFYRENTDRLHDVSNAYKLAGEMGVGAEVYKTYLEGTGENVQFAVVVEFLSGADFEWKPLSKKKHSIRGEAFCQKS